MGMYQSQVNAGSNTYCGTESSYHMNNPLNVDAEGGENSILGYSANHTSKVRVTKTEHIVEFGRFPTTTDYKYSPSRKELYTDHEAGDKPLLVPWGIARDPRDKADELFPQSRRELVFDKVNSSPRIDDYKDNSPASSGKYNYLNGNDKNDGVYVQSAREKGYDNDHDGIYKRNGYVPSETRSERGRDVEFDDKNGKNSPVSTTTQWPHYDSPTRKGRGYQETIDSAEAHRRYGRATPGARAYAEEKYTGVIDSKEAARKYNGVLFKA